MLLRDKLSHKATAEEYTEANPDVRLECHQPRSTEHIATRPISTGPGRFRTHRSPARDRHVLLGAQAEGRSWADSCARFGGRCSLETWLAAFERRLFEWGVLVVDDLSSGAEAGTDCPVHVAVPHLCGFGAGPMYPPDWLG